MKWFVTAHKKKPLIADSSSTNPKGIIKFSNYKLTLKDIIVFKRCNNWCVCVQHTLLVKQCILNYWLDICYSGTKLLSYEHLCRSGWCITSLASALKIHVMEGHHLLWRPPPGIPGGFENAFFPPSHSYWTGLTLLLDTQRQWCQKVNK